MQLPLGFGDLDFDDWVRGLVAAFVGGGASAFSAGVANVLNHPTAGIWHIEFWSTVSTTFVIAGLIAMFMFLRTSPIPDRKQVVTTVETTTQGQKAPVVVSTVQETTTEPIKADASKQP